MPKPDPARPMKRPPDPFALLISELRATHGDPLAFARALGEHLGGEATVFVRKRRRNVVVQGAFWTGDFWDERSVSIPIDTDVDDAPPEAVAETAAAAVGIEVMSPWRAGRALTEPFVFGMAGGTVAMDDMPGMATTVELLLARDVTAISARTAALQLERARLAAGIHETVAQDLTTLTMQLDVLDELMARSPARAAQLLAEVRSSARNAQRSVREALAELTPTGPSKSLERRLRSVLKSFSSDVETTFHIEGKIGAVDDDISDLVVGFLRESLTNMRKHADNPGDIHIVTEHDQLKITVRSAADGGTVLLRPGHGLEVMRSYARLLGGDVSIVRNTGNASEVTLTAPI